MAARGHFLRGASGEADLRRYGMLFMPHYFFIDHEKFDPIAFINFTNSDDAQGEYRVTDMEVWNGRVGKWAFFTDANTAFHCKMLFG